MRDINMTFCFAHSVAERTLKRFSFHIKNLCPWKSNSLISETKNRFKNLKHNYVAFSLPCNLNKKHGIFMFFFFFKDFRFKNLIFRFIHRVSAFKKNCLTCSFSLQYQYILQPTVLENKETYQLDGVKLTQHFILWKYLLHL